MKRGRISKVIDSRYELLDEIGMCGMGEKTDSKNGIGYTVTVLVFHTGMAFAEGKDY